MIDPIANLEKLIKEMIVSQELLPRSPVERLIYNEEYVQGVLGISIPLNESYPYSIELQERILQEQLLFEGFFSDFKKLGGDTKNLALAMRYMMEDGSRIKDFVSTAYETVIKDPLEKIVKFIKAALSGFKELFSKFALPKVQDTWDAIKEVLKGFGEKLEGAWDKIKGMSGWKQALVVMAFGTALGYLWSEKGIGDIVETANGIIDKLKETIPKAADALSDITAKLGDSTQVLSLTKESVIASPSMVDLLYDKDTLNEFFGSKKKKKDNDSSASDKAEKVDKATDAVDKASEIAGKLGGEELDLISKVKEEIMGQITPLVKVIKDKVVDAFKGIAKQIGADALIGLASGGVGTFISGIKKAFGGVKLVSTLFGDTLGKFVSKIKNPDEEAKEAEAGEDDPTDDSTKKDEKKEEKKESVLRDERLLREFIREKLLAA